MGGVRIPSRNLSLYIDSLVPLHCAAIFGDLAEQARNRDNFISVKLNSLDRQCFHLAIQENKVWGKGTCTAFFHRVAIQKRFPVTSLRFTEALFYNLFVIIGLYFILLSKNRLVALCGKDLLKNLDANFANGREIPELFNS